jgi:hypothetical protein
VNVRRTSFIYRASTGIGRAATGENQPWGKWREAREVMGRTGQVTTGGYTRRRRLAIALGLAVVLFAAATARLFVWPDLDTPPVGVDAIIELAGPGERDQTALDLARGHKAPVLAQSTTATEERTGDCLPPVPGVTIVCFHADPETTRGEARRIGRLARQYHWKSIVLVTTRDHVWRARLRVSRCFPGDIYVTTAPLPPLDWFYVIPYQWAATAKALVVERDC